MVDLAAPRVTASVPVHAHNLPREIDAIVEDTLGYLWLSSNRGVTRVLASELMACEEAPSCTPHIKTYGSSDGMPTDDTSSTGHPGAWRDADGELWFATRKGVAIVNPTHVSENQTPPPVVIERFTVDDTNWKLTDKESTIPPGHVRYAFEYAALSYVSPSRSPVSLHPGRVRQAVDQAGSRRNAYYTNLPPRQYRFRVQAANENGVWNEEGAEFSFLMKPPFYRTLWFLGIIAMLLFGLAFAAYRIRVRVNSFEFDAILAERNRIAREIHDTLAQGFVGVSTAARTDRASARAVSCSRGQPTGRSHASASTGGASRCAAQHMGPPDGQLAGNPADAAHTTR